MLLRLHLLALALVVLPAYSEQFYANRYGKRQEFGECALKYGAGQNAEGGSLQTLFSRSREHCRLETL